MAIKAQTLLTRRENVGRRVICNKQAFLVDWSKAETGGQDILTLLTARKAAGEKKSQSGNSHLPSLIRRKKYVGSVRAYFKDFKVKAKKR